MIISNKVEDTLLDNRIIVLSEQVSDCTADAIIKTLLYFNSQSKSKDIHFYLNCCPGGSVDAGCAIIDTMKSIDAPVATYCLGAVASMGAMLTACGEKGKRYMAQLARIMTHQVSSGYKGTNEDIQIAAEQTRILNERMFKMLAHTTGRTYKQIMADCNRDYWMDADAALEYGIVDHILPYTKSKLDFASFKEVA